MRELLQLHPALLLGGAETVWLSSSFRRGGGGVLLLLSLGEAGV